MTEWVDERVPTSVVHLDVAACGRVSRAVLDTEVAHLHREAAVGGYVAQQHAAARLDEGRSTLAAMVGLQGGDVAFSDGAGTSFATLLAAWPLPRGARVGTVPSEYGANAAALQRLSTERGWRLEMLSVDPAGRIVDVPADLDLVTFPHIASQRGIVQPVDDVFATGAPILLDVAQSLGQVSVPPGCAAYVGTSRKWLCGPRGVGFAIVDPVVQEALTEPPTLAPAHGTGMLRWESQEAHIAGRVGLATAVEQWTPEAAQSARRAAAYARQVLGGVSGWTIQEPADEKSALVTLLGPDPVKAREQLLHSGFLTSAIPVSRAADMRRPVLRVSTAAWVDTDQLDRFTVVLADCTG